MHKAESQIKPPMSKLNFSSTEKVAAIVGSQIPWTKSDYNTGLNKCKNFGNDLVGDIFVLDLRSFVDIFGLLVRSELSTYF